jgi:surface polysaccharide O-acyltransferase-like enzyme
VVGVELPALSIFTYVGYYVLGFVLGRQKITSTVSVVGMGAYIVGAAGTAWITYAATVLSRFAVPVLYYWFVGNSRARLLQSGELT